MEPTGKTEAVEGAKQPERYRLEWQFPKILSLDWAYKENGCVSEDCYVRAIRAETDPKKFIEQKNRPHSTEFTEPVTIKEARKIISNNRVMLGGAIHDCLGLELEDANREVRLFARPIRIRNPL